MVVQSRCARTSDGCLKRIVLAHASSAPSVVPCSLPKTAEPGHWLWQVGYLRVHFGNVPEEERQRVREQLERYCEQDTEGMVWIVEALQNITGQSQR